MIKKISVLSFIVVFCISSLFADCPKNRKIKECEDITRKVGCDQAVLSSCNKSTINSCDKGIIKAKDCLERLLCDKLGKFECTLESEFRDQNAFFQEAVEALGLRLKVSLASKKHASTTLLKDFIQCRLLNTEENLILSIGEQLNCLKQFLCHKLKAFDCELDHILCQATDVVSEIECMENILMAYITIFIEWGNPSSNPFYLSGRIQLVLADFLACYESALIDICASDIPASEIPIP